jgi:hypothetical protein
MFAREQRRSQTPLPPAHRRVEPAPVFEPASGPVLLRKVCPCGGGCSTCAADRQLDENEPASPLPAKLEIGAVNDPLEHEADRVADHVTSMANPHASVSGGGFANGQSKSGGSPPEILQRKPVRHGALNPAVLPAHVQEALHSSGRPMDAGTRQFFEPRFDRDFSDVRIHTGPGAAASAQAVSALAYTLGRDVVFNTGQYAPHTRQGQHLLAHELSHVVQQSGGAVAIQRSPDRDLIECSGGVAELLPPGKWLKCARAGMPPADVLRHATDGAIVTRDWLFAWAERQGVADDKLVAKVLHSSEFAGTESQRKEAADALRSTKADERHEEVFYQAAIERSQNEERNREEEARRREEAVQRRREDRLRLHSEWLYGQGGPASALGQPTGLKRAKRELQIFNSEGEIVNLSYPDEANLKRGLGQLLAAIQKRSKQSPGALLSALQADRQIVEETLDDAAWYQRFGLALVHLGYSKSAIAFGVAGLKRYVAAREEAQSGVEQLQAGKLQEATRSLVDAQENEFTARHWLNKMQRQREEDDGTSLGRLEHISEAGDLATSVLPPGLQFGLSTVKNFGVHASNYHSNPNAEFGWKSLVLETAGNYVAGKVTGTLGGTNPTFARRWFAGMAGVQSGKFVGSGFDPGQLVDVSPKDLALTGAFAIRRPQILEPVAVEPAASSAGPKKPVETTAKAPKKPPPAAQVKTPDPNLTTTATIAAIWRGVLTASSKAPKPQGAEPRPPGIPGADGTTSGKSAPAPVGTRPVSDVEPVRPDSPKANEIPVVPPVKRPYINKNPKSTATELEIGDFLDGKAQAGELKGVSRVEGAPESKGTRNRSGDYRFHQPDGTQVGADLYEPETTNTRSIVTGIFKKSGQAEVAVLRLGKGTSGQLSLEQAHSMARDVVTTPGVGINRVIVVKEGHIIVDESR